MRAYVGKIGQVNDTGALMKRLAVKYCTDVIDHADDTLYDFHRRIAGIPYRRDPALKFRRKNSARIEQAAAEVLQRPAITLSGAGLGGDCDDKAICIGAYCALKRIPFRYVAAGRYQNAPLHHVYTEVLLNGKIIPVDPTYAYCTYGARLWPEAKRQIISDF